MPIPCFVAVTLAGMLASVKSAKDARAHLFIGPITRISPVVSAPGEPPHARSEITIGPIVTFARETPEEVVRAPCVEGGASARCSAAYDSPPSALCSPAKVSFQSYVR